MSDAKFMVLLAVQTASLLLLIYVMVIRPPSNTDGGISPSGTIMDESNELELRSREERLVQRWRDDTVLHDLIRDVLKEELQQWRTAMNNSVETDRIPPHAKPPAPSEQNIIAAQQIRSAVEQALANGVWTKDDTTAVRKHIGNLLPSDREEIAASIAAAINRQELDISGEIPPL